MSIFNDFPMIGAEIFAEAVGRVLKALPRSEARKVPIFACGGCAMAENRHRARELGIECHREDFDMGEAIVPGGAEEVR